MKTTSFKTVLLVSAILTVSFIGCNNPPRGDNATITEAQTPMKKNGYMYQVDTSASEVKFTGYGVGKNHPGNFRLVSGKIAVDDDKLSGGEFVINIRSMRMNEQGDMFEKKLRPHLLSGDFFDANQFGEAKFVITGSEPYTPSDKDSSIVEGANLNISGNLTIKGETRNITFPARVDLDENTLKGKADFDIDRTQWKMNYGNDKTLGDKFISSKVNIEFYLEAKRQ